MCKNVAAEAMLVQGLVQGRDHIRRRNALNCARAASLPLALLSCTAAIGIETLSNSPAEGAGAGGTDGAAGTEGPGGTVGPGDAGGTALEIAEGPAANFDDYVFSRGSTADVAAPGVLGNDRGVGTRVAVAGDRATERGGVGALQVDGSFRYAPPNDRFWGNDYFDYQRSDAESDVLTGRVRLSVQPDSILLDDISAGLGGGFSLTPGEEGDGIGSEAAAAGDVDGDKIDDFIVTAYGGGSYAAYVVFGERTAAGAVAPPGISITGLVARGHRSFRIIGGSERITSVAGAGDVNGDGLDDVVLGVPDESFATPGAAYVVFGGVAEGDDVLLDDLRNGRGFRMTGLEAGEHAGLSVSGAGDVDGDGLADVVVASTASSASAAYVVFGTTSPQPVVMEAAYAGPTLAFADLDDNQQGFTINSVPEASPFDSAGASVAGAGDVNGDGLSDVIVMFTYGRFGATPTGRAHVVFGKRGSLPVDLEALAGGFEIQVQVSGDLYGDVPMVSGAGDVNDDGLADVLVGAASSRSAFVVFGRDSTTPVMLSQVGSAASGFAVGADSYDAEVSVDTSAAAGGDVDGDGTDDVIVGVSTSEGGNAGKAILAFGKVDGAPVSFVNLTASMGCEIHAAEASTLRGLRVAGLGDVNDDGLGDLLVAASGTAHVLFGWDARGRLAQRDGVLHGGPSDDSSLAYDGRALVAIRGGNGVDTLVLSDAVSTLDLRKGGERLESIEVIDLISGDHTLLLDDAALRGVPQSRAQLVNGLARTLVVLANAGDSVQLHAAGYSKTGSNQDGCGSFATDQIRQNHITV